jgi:branched-chain amino acid transport system substrate-binding protein
MKLNRHSLAVILTGAFLAGCGGAAAPASPSTPAGSAVAPASKPAAASAPAASVSAKPAASAAAGSGSASAKPAASAKPSGSAAAATSTGPIKIGIVLPLTGPLADVGKDNQDGFNLYLQSIDSSVAGRKIQPIFADSKGAADEALTKTKQLVESDKVSLLMGFNGTPECYAVAPYVKQAQIPLVVSTNCSAQALTTDPRYASPYLARITETSFQAGAFGDWAYKKGYRKVSLIVSDFGGGLENGDAFAATFVNAGGTVVQEQYPPLGTADYGPYVAKLDPSADFILVVLFGADGLRFQQALNTYSGQKKPVILDLSSGILAGPNRGQLGDSVLGITASYIYTTAFDSPLNNTFVKNWNQQYKRYVAKDGANGYAGAEVLEAAVKRVNGNVEDKQKFLDAIDATAMDTNKGPIKLDSHHDVVQNLYVFDLTKNGNTLDERLVDTYKEVPSWGIGRTEEQAAKFPLGQLKGKWAGMTRDGLSKLYP